MDTDNMSADEIRAKIKELQAMLASSRGDDENSDIEQGHPIALPGQTAPLATGEGGIYNGDSDPKFVATQTKADRVAQAFGDSAPRPHAGESHLEYRRRLLNNFKAHSKSWRSADLSKLAGRVLDIAEAQIFSDAVAHAHDPANVPEGTLREVVSTDASGRRITKFIGSPSACWDVFRLPTQFVKAWPAK